MSNFSKDIRPRIIGDFNFGGIDYMVVYWPEGDFGDPETGEVIDSQQECFTVYRTDIPWQWLPEAIDVRQ